MWKNKIGFCLLILLSLFTVYGCNKDKPTKNAENQYRIFYCNSEETELIGVPYEATAKTTEKLIRELMDTLSNEPKSLKYKKVKPDEVELLTFEINDDKQLTLHFNSAYTEMTGVPEILFRAAVVKMMCQIDGVDYVEIYVEDQPLMKTADKPYGFESADDFIDNTGRDTNFSQNVTMSLYFANEKGNGLKEVRVKVKYDGTVSLEQLIIQCLIDGPDKIEKLDEESVQATIPKGTVISKVSIREGVCYVYFNSIFLNKRLGITDEVAIYSVVDSLCEVSTINKVQFMVDQNATSGFRNKKQFDNYFERNLDLVEN